jgi:hypothetical protein
VIRLKTQSPSERGDGDCAFSLAALNRFGFNGRLHTPSGLMDSRRYRAGARHLGVRRLPRSRGTMAGKLQIDADKGFPRGHSLPLRPLCATISIIRVNLFPSAVGLLIRVRSRFPFAALGEIFNSQPVAPKALRRRIHPPSYSRPFAVPIRGPYSRSLIRGP